MKVAELQDTTLYYSSVSESTYSEWSSSTAYNTGDRVYVTKESDGTTERTPHEVYESLANSNTGNYPPDNADKWSLVGATNRWKMFDGYVNTQTEDSSDIEIKIDASGTDCVSFFDLEAKRLELTVKSNNPTSGLQAGWDFDEGSGTTVYDRTSNDNDGTIYGASFADGKFGKAISFDGVDDYVSVPHDSTIDFDTTDNYTISLWLKIPSTDQPDLSWPWNYVLSKGSVPRPYAIWFYNQTKKLGIQRQSSSEEVHTVSTTSFNDDAWHFVVAVFNGDTLSLYVDGALESSSTQSFSTSVSNTDNLIIGRYGSSSYWCQCCVDDLRIYNRALTASEISSMYSAYKIETIDLLNLTRVDYYYYFFSDYEWHKKYMWTYPNWSNSYLYAKIVKKSTTDAKCGMMAVGKLNSLGVTLAEPSLGIIDYSKKTTDSLGRTYLSQGVYADRSELDFWLPTSNIDGVMSKLVDLRATPAVYSVDNAGEELNYKSLLIYGFYQDFEIVISGPKVSKCKITIEGLT